MYEQLQTHYSDLPISVSPVKQHKTKYKTKQESLMNSKIWGSFSSVAEESYLPGYDIMSLALSTLKYQNTFIFKSYCNA